MQQFKSTLLPCLIAITITNAYNGTNCDASSAWKNHRFHKEKESAKPTRPIRLLHRRLLQLQGRMDVLENASEDFIEDTLKIVTETKKLCDELHIDTTPIDWKSLCSDFTERKIGDACAVLTSQINSILTKVCAIEAAASGRGVGVNFGTAITQSDIPFVITTPGNYFVTEPLVYAPATGNVIDSGLVDGVTIDMCGHSLKGDTTGALIGALRGKLTVKNGTLENGSGSGIFVVTGSNPLLVENMNIRITGGTADAIRNFGLSTVIRDVIIQLGASHTIGHGTNTLQIKISDFFIQQLNPASGGFAILNGATAVVKPRTSQVQDGEVDYNGTGIVIDVSGASGQVQNVHVRSDTASLTSNSPIFKVHATIKDSSSMSFTNGTGSGIAAFAVVRNCKATGHDLGFFEILAGGNPAGEMMRLINNVAHNCVAGFAITGGVRSSFESNTAQNCTSFGYRFVGGPATTREIVLRNNRSINDASSSFVGTGYSSDASTFDHVFIGNTAQGHLVGFDNFAVASHIYVNNKAVGNTTPYTGTIGNTFSIGALAGERFWHNAIS